MARKGGKQRAARAFIDRMTLEADSLKTATVGRLSPVVRGASASVAQEIRFVLGGIDPAAPYTRSVHHKMLLRLRDRLGGAEVAVRDAASMALNDALERAGKMAHRHASEWVSKASRSLGGKPLALATRESTVLRDARTLLSDRQARAAAKLATDISTDIRKQLALGHVRGESVGKVLKRLGKLGGPKSQSLEESLSARHNRLATRVAVTETVTAYNAGQRSISRRTGAGRRWDAKLDRRTCAVCRELDGEVRPVGEDFSGGYSQPPAHPHCRCTTSVWLPEWGEL